MTRALSARHVAGRLNAHMARLEGLDPNEDLRPFLLIIDRAYREAVAVTCPLVTPDRTLVDLVRQAGTARNLYHRVGAVTLAVDVVAGEDHGLDPADDPTFGDALVVIDVEPNAPRPIAHFLAYARHDDGTREITDVRAFDPATDDALRPVVAALVTFACSRGTYVPEARAGIRAWLLLQGFPTSQFALRRVPG